MNDHLKDKAKEAFDLVASKQPQKVLIVGGERMGIASRVALCERARDQGVTVEFMTPVDGSLKFGGVELDQAVIDDFQGLLEYHDETTGFKPVPRGTISGTFELEPSSKHQDVHPLAMDALTKGETPMFEDPENWDVVQLRGKWMLFMYKGKAIMRLCRVNRPLYAKAFGIPPQQYHYNWQSVAPGAYCVPVGKLGLLQKTCNIRDAFVYAKDEAKRRDIKEARKK